MGDIGVFDSALIANNVIGPASATDSAIALFDGTTGKKIKDSAKIIETTLTVSDSRVPTSKAVKDYADSLLPLLDALIYKGVINCSANPNYPAADAGHTYKVSVAGKIGGASGPNVEIGDLLLCTLDGSPAGDHATVGANWDIIQTNIDGAVIGPASSTADAIALFNSTTGKLIKDSAKTIVTTLGADDTTLPTSKAVRDYALSTGNQFVIDGGGFAIQAGTQFDIRVLQNCTLTLWDILNKGRTDANDAIQIDIWKCTYAQYDDGATHPVNADSIIAGSEIKIVAGASNYKNQASGLTITLLKGDILRVNVDSCVNIKLAEIYLDVTRT